MKRLTTDDSQSILYGLNLFFLFDTFDYGEFEEDDVGKRVFWKIEDAQKAAAALKGGQDA